MSKLTVIFAFLLMPLLIARAQGDSVTEAPIEPIGEQEKTAVSQTPTSENLFRKLFATRRKEHLEAVRSLRKMESYERLYKMIMVLAEKVVEVIETSKIIVENAAFSPGNSSFPEDTSVRDALSTILENTALFADIILHLPDITHRILKNHQKWHETIRWSLNFANQTRHLLDKSTVRMVNLVAQELNITERETGYFNPYWSRPVVRDKNEEPKKKKTVKKEKRKRGPQMIKIEL